MAEPRRLEFTTIAPPQKTKKKVSSAPPSQRFKLTLTLSTETTCPEFSYTELVKNAMVKKDRGGGGDVGGGKEGAGADPDDPFAEDEDGKLEAIAKAFEAKYGPKVKTKKGRPSDRVRDLVDLGDGYDETDDFIDNTEAYDEIVPRCLTTKLGGFYINSGQLDFRYASEDSADEFQKIPMKKKRKIRTIESDSDSNSEIKKKGPKKMKLKDGVDGEKKKTKKIRIGPDGEKIVVKRGRKPLDKNKLKKKTSPTVSELLKHQTTVTSTPTHALNGTGDGGVKDEDGYNPFDSSAIGSTIELLLKEDSESKDGDEDRRPENAAALPTTLPENLAQKINDIKMAARNTSEGKCKFFSGNVNKMLLDIEMMSRQLSCSNRQTIYNHLSCFLPCGKETLLKRAKKLRLTQQEDLMREPVNKLRAAVNQMMPPLLEKYDAEMQLAQLMRMENKEKSADSDNKETKEEGSTESDDEGQGDGEKKKRIMGPRKKFEWTDHVRSLLCDVVRVKLKTFAAAKQRGQSAEEYIRFFLDTEIRPIWPQGWMQTRMLYKESRAAHAVFTNPQKQRKSLQGVTKSGSPTPFQSRSTNNSIIEIFDNVEAEMKEGSESDKELRLEDYMDVMDVDKMLTEITKTDSSAMPSILDYADNKANSEAGATPDVKKTAASVEPGQRTHSSGLTNNSATKSREGIKHGLVSEMLQSPTIPARVPVPNVLSPNSDHPPQKNAFMAEFEKHVMASKPSKGSKESSEKTSPDQSAASKLQSMLVQAQQQANSSQMKHLGTPKGGMSPSQHHDVQKSGGASHRQSLVHNSPSSMHHSAQSPRVTHGSPSSHGNHPPHKLSLPQGQRMPQTQAAKTTGQSGQLKSPITSSTIDQEAVKQLQQQLIQLATASAGGYGASQYKSQGGLGKTASTNKQTQDSVVGQLFKQPLPANLAQQRQSMQPTKTSLLKIDTQNTIGGAQQRHSPQDQSRMSPQGHPRSLLTQGQKQSPALHMSGGSIQSTTTNRKSPAEMAKTQQPVMNIQQKRVVNSKEVIRQKEVEKSILEKVLDEYQIELKAKAQQQQQFAGPQRVSPSAQRVPQPVHSPSQGTHPRQTWPPQQTTGSSPPSTGSPRQTAFSPTSGNPKPSKPMPHMNLAGYQNVSHSSGTTVSMATMQQRPRPQELITGAHGMPTTPQGAQSPGSYSIHGQTQGVHSSLSPNRQITGVVPPHTSPHLYLQSTTPTTTVNPLYGRTLQGPPQSPNRY